MWRSCTLWLQIFRKRKQIWNFTSAINKYIYIFHYFPLNDLVYSRWQLISFRADPPQQICLDSYGPRRGVALVCNVASYPPSKTAVNMASTARETRRREDSFAAPGANGTLSGCRANRKNGSRPFFLPGTPAPRRVLYTHISRRPAALRRPNWSNSVGQ